MASRDIFGPTRSSDTRVATVYNWAVKHEWRDIFTFELNQVMTLVKVPYVWVIILSFAARRLDR